MEFEPQSEEGKRVSTVLENWLKRSPDSAVDKLKRIFIANSSKVMNEDDFVAVLYGQSILNESPPSLSQRFPSTLLRVQHGMEVSLNKRCPKALVVALERSGNQNLLAEARNWVQKSSKDIQDNFQRKSSIELAPERVQKRKLLSEITSGTVTPRHREINWEGDEKECRALEVHNDKILVGWSNGQIKIYNSNDLECQTALNYCKTVAGVTHLQCTGTEVIASYQDRNICVWNIQRQVLLDILRAAENEAAKEGYPSCMRYRDPKLVVGTLEGKIHIWQKDSSSFTLLGSWDGSKRAIIALDFNQDYVLVQPHGITGSVSVHYFNGQPFRTISPSAGTLRMVVHRE